MGSAERTTWTCSRCRVTASWMAGSEGGGQPVDWRQDGEELYCLGCRRAVAADAGVETAPEDTPISDLARVRTRAMVEFEIRRMPERSNSLIARACRTSVPAVVKARRRIGIPAP